MENGTRDVICVHSHFNHPLSASKQTTGGIFRAMQRRATPEHALENSGAVPMDEVPSFILSNIAVADQPPRILESELVQEDEDVIPEASEEQQMPGENEAQPRGKAAKNPRRSQRQKEKMHTDRNDAAVRTIQNSLVMRLEVKHCVSPLVNDCSVMLWPCNPGETQSSGGNTECIVY